MLLSSWHSDLRVTIILIGQIKIFLHSVNKSVGENLINFLSEIKSISFIEPWFIWYVNTYFALSFFDKEK